MISNVRILLCDDHELVRSGIMELLKNDKFFIIGQASDGEQMIEKYFEFKPDIIIADISMPKLSGFEAAKKILSEDPQAKILFVSVHCEEYVISSYILGVKGILSKNITRDELILAIKIIMQGEIYFGADYSESRLKELVKKHHLAASYSDSIEVITAKEEEVLKYISEGLMSIQIAERMNLNKKTIDAHRQKIIHKFNLKTLAGLMKFAIEYTNAKKTMALLYFLTLI